MSEEQFHVDEVSASYWRVTFDNGPVNLLDPDTIDQLGALIGRIENDPDLAVVVFRSDKPGYFMAHWDFLSDNARVAGMQPGPTGLHPYADNFVRLSRLPVATVSEIRGRSRCSRTASSSPTASRPTSAPRSGSYDRTPNGREAG
jgi:enoyl-CoA hydratase/carnithine racemase